MSAWVLALGLSAGYLVHKRFQFAEKLDEVIKKADGPVDEIRRVQRTVPDADKYQDINVSDQTAGEVRKLTEAREKQHQVVAKFEEGPAPIQGVWLNVPYAA